MRAELLEQSSEAIADAIKGDLLSAIDDIVPILFQDNPTRFLKATYVPVSGTNHSFVTFELDTIALDVEVRAALRTRGFEIPDGDGVIVSQVRSP